MSLLYENTVKHNFGFSNRIQPSVTSLNSQFCFTCTKIRAPPECVSAVLELQNLEDDIETKANILQVICQLLRVQWGSLESDILENENLPFCSTCLKIVSEIIILREKLFQTETEIREKLWSLGSSVADCCEDAYEENIPPKGYDDLRIFFRKEVMEEHLNKELMQSKILQLNRNPVASASESVPSMVQLHFEKSVFYVDDRKRPLEKEILEEPFSEVFRDKEFCDFEDNDLSPALEDEGDHGTVPAALDGEEDFKLVPVIHEETTGKTVTDESDDASPSKRSRTDLMNDTSHFRQSKTQTPILEKIWRLTTNSAPSTSSKQVSDSNQETNLNDDDGDSDWIPKSDGGSAASDSNSDSENGDPEKKEDEVVENENECEPEEPTISLAELCEKHVFTPRNEQDFVKIEQAEATFKARDNTYWTTREPTKTRKKRAYEILRQGGGLVGPAQDKTLTPSQLFKLMFTPTIVETIVKHTNAYAEYVAGTSPDKNGCIRKWNCITVDEMYAYIGMLLYFGLESKRRFSYADVWKKGTRDADLTFAQIIGAKRFREISSFLRFDDKVARTTNVSTNEVEDSGDSKFSYISEVFNTVVENMQALFRPYDALVVGDIFVNFHGSSSFVVVNAKSKTGSKYGIKLWTVCDAETGYILKISLHEGKVGDKGEKDLGKKVVLDLVQKYFGSGRGVTMDEYFTSIALGQALIKKNMSMLGTLDHKGMDIIPKFVSAEGRGIHSSVFAFQGDFTMVSYVPTKGKRLILLSTEHHSAEVNPNNQDEPRMLVDYNCTKGAVETAEKMISTYTCQKISRRWPVKIFYALLDIAAFNSYTIYRMHKGSEDSMANERSNFLKSLAEGLMKPISANRQIQRNPVYPEISLRYDKSCKFCPVGERKSAGRRCGMCLNYTCRECGTLIFRCPNCPLKQVPATRDMPNVDKKLRNQKRCCKFCQPKGKQSWRRCDVCQENVCSDCGTTMFRCPECPLKEVPSEQKNLSTGFESERVRRKVSNFTPSSPLQAQSPSFSANSTRRLLSSPRPGVSSPRARLSSPRPRLSSPCPTMRSPRARLSTPRPTLSSRHPGLISPRPTLSSPHPGLSTPRLRFSSLRVSSTRPLLSYPSQPMASPSRLLTYPTQPNASTSQLLSYPSQPMSSTSQLLSYPTQPMSSTSQLLSYPTQPMSSTSPRFSSPIFLVNPEQLPLLLPQNFSNLLRSPRP